MFPSALIMRIQRCVKHASSPHGDNRMVWIDPWKGPDCGKYSCPGYSTGRDLGVREDF